jgi:hypothetical protein
MTDTRTPLFNVEVWNGDPSGAERLAVDFYDRETADACVKAWGARRRMARVVPYAPRRGMPMTETPLAVALATIQTLVDDGYLIRHEDGLLSSAPFHPDYIEERTSNG